MSSSKQKFKAIYFQEDLETLENNSKSFTLAFSQRELDLYESIKHLSSLEIRQILGVNTINHLQEVADKEGLPLNRYCIWKIKKELAKNNKLEKRSQSFNIDPVHTTFRGGKNLPLQSWYPYLEGYSPDFVRYIIDNYTNKNTKNIYDPFSGSGTTPIVASDLGYQAFYSEVNPLLQFLTNIKAKARNYKNRNILASRIEELAENLDEDIKKMNEDQELKKAYENTFCESKFFPERVYSEILQTKTYINLILQKEIILGELLTVAATSALLPSSLLKRQGDLRFKRDDELQNIDNINYIKEIKSNLYKIANDIRVIEPTVSPILLTEDAKNIHKLPFLGIDAVITSPPYLNGTNYFRNTKMELWFLGYLKSKKDLSKYRRMAITAGINDVSLEIKKDIENKELKELLETIENTAYDKRIPKMIHDYFSDMKAVFCGIKKQLNKNAVIAIDLGDSIYSGVHVKTDEILISIMKEIGYSFQENIVLRKRISNNGQELKQVLLIFRNNSVMTTKKQIKFLWEDDWKNFKNNLPHHSGEMAKRNWGDKMHSLCSYQGKLKPSIANQLVSTFVPDGGSVLDIFGGVGTIPLEASLQEKKSYSFDISPAAIIISKAKLSQLNTKDIATILDDLEIFIKKDQVEQKIIEEAEMFGYNKKLKEYFHPKTLKEIVLAREYFKSAGYDSGEKALVLSSLLHILHGNRPYALSRRSHGITPFAPTGEFEYKNLIEKLKDKIERTMSETSKRKVFKEGSIYFQDATKTWPDEIRGIDAIITSPPFFDSTRFYLANWMRLWLAGWNDASFKTEPIKFIDELQKKDLSVYDNIFMQSRERLKEGGVLVLHLGKSKKCDMAKVLAERARRWFDVYDVFGENVENTESHGIRDKGTVVEHQYLVLK